MCFYVYAPNRKLRILYESESIGLESDGTSSVLADCLVKNTSDTPLQAIKIIYPNRLYKIKKLFKNKVKPENQREYSKVYFINKSQTFDDDSLPENQIYKIYRSKTTDSAGPLKPWGFDLPNPENIESPTKIEGLIDTAHKDTLSLETFDNNMLCGLLYDINYTVLSYEFATLIKSGEARWIRLKFRGEKSAKVSAFMKYIILRRFTNSLSYLYQIFGPYNVKADFIHRLNIGSDLQNPSSQGFKKLIENFQYHGVIKNPDHADSETTFEAISINVEPREVEQFHPIDEAINEGSAEREGDFPDVIISGQRYKDVYRWKVINDDNNVFSFFLRFRAKPINLSYLLVPVIAVLVAFTAACVAFTSLCIAVGWLKFK